MDFSNLFIYLFIYLADMFRNGQGTMDGTYLAQKNYLQRIFVSVNENLFHLW